MKRELSAFIVFLLVFSLNSENVLAWAAGNFNTKDELNLTAGVSYDNGIVSKVVTFSPAPALCNKDTVRLTNKTSGSEYLINITNITGSCSSATLQWLTNYTVGTTAYYYLYYGNNTAIENATDWLYDIWWDNFNSYDTNMWRTLPSTNSPTIIGNNILKIEYTGGTDTNPSGIMLRQNFTDFPFIVEVNTSGDTTVIFGLRALQNNGYLNIITGVHATQNQPNNFVYYGIRSGGIWWAAGSEAGTCANLTNGAANKYFKTQNKYNTNSNMRMVVTTPSGNECWADRVKNFDVITSIVVGAGDGINQFQNVSWIKKYANHSFNVYDDQPTLFQYATVAGDPPQWSNNQTKISSPATFTPSQNYGFQITFGGATSVNFTLNSTLYTTATTPAVQNSSSTYWINFTQEQLGAAGYYTYYWTGGNASGTNTTPTWSYQINKGSTTIYLALNSSQSDVSMTYPAASNATAWKDLSGGTLTLLRNGSSVGNPELVQLGAGGYNYTTTLEHQNYTASAVQRILSVIKAASGLSLTVSPSWSISEGTSITITCSANTARTLTKDSVTVASPYTAALQFGQYNFTCTIPDTQNYTPSIASNILNVIAGGFGCTNTSTYTFTTTVTSNITRTVLNFTQLVTDKYVREDLRDVWINTSLNLTAQKNITSGYLFVVNSENISSFTIKFGNYIGNNSWSNTSSITNITSFTYSETGSSYYVISLLNEVDGTYLLPPNATTTLTALCNNGASSFQVNHTKILLPTFDTLDEMKASVVYSATDQYSRNIILSDAVIAFKNIYLVDAVQKQMVQMILTMVDYNNKFNNAIFKVQKYLEGTLITVTEQRFDAENKVIVYLINGDRYVISIDNGNEIRSFGNLYVDPTDLTKTLTITSSIKTYDRKLGEIMYNLTMVNGVIKFHYYDPSTQTLNTTMWVYNSTNTSQVFFTATSTNQSLVTFIYTTPNQNATYKVVIKISHKFFGENSQFITQFLSGVSTALLLPIAVPTNIITGASMILITTIPMLFGGYWGAFAALFTVAIAAFLAFWGLYPISGIFLVIAGVIAVMNIFAKRRRVEES